MDSNYDCGGKPGQPHWTEEPKPGVAAAKADNEREAFEAAYTPLHPACISRKTMFERHGDGGYSMLRVQGAWEGWQARAVSDTGEALDAARWRAWAKSIADYSGAPEKDPPPLLTALEKVFGDEPKNLTIEEVNRGFDAARSLSAGGEA